MFKSEKYYLCLKTRKNDSKCINAFIEKVFKNSNIDFIDYSSVYDGYFKENNIYYSPCDEVIIDDLGQHITILDDKGFEFRELDINLAEIEGLASRLFSKRCELTVKPKYCFGDEIFFLCMAKAIGYYGTIGEGLCMNSDPMEGVVKAYKMARKNLIEKCACDRGINIWQLRY